MLSFGSLLYTTTFYYLLKTYLVEWGCRRFLKGRVRLCSDYEAAKKRTEASVNGHTHAVNGVVTKPATGGSESLTLVTKGDMAEVAQL